MLLFFLAFAFFILAQLTAVVVTLVQVRLKVVRHVVWRLHLRQSFDNHPIFSFFRCNFPRQNALLRVVFIFRIFAFQPSAQDSSGVFVRRRRGNQTRIRRVLLGRTAKVTQRDQRGVVIE